MPNEPTLSDHTDLAAAYRRHHISLPGGRLGIGFCKDASMRRTRVRFLGVIVCAGVAALLPARLAAQPPAAAVPVNAPLAPRTLAEEALLSSSGAAEAASLPAATNDAQVAREIARLQQLAREGQLDAASAGADALVSRFPREPCAYAIRGLISAEAKDFARANSDLDQALSLAPTSGVIRFGRARVLNRQGRADEAIDEFKKCAEFPAANFELLATLHQLKRTTEAKRYAEQRVELRPRDPVCFTQLAKVELWSENHDAAISAATKAIELDPSNAEAWFLRAHCLLGRNDVAEAKADIAESILRTKDSVSRAAQYGFLATSDYLRGDLESAYANSSAAVREDPSSADYLKVRAVVQVRREQALRAHEDLTLAIEGIRSGRMTTTEKDGLAAFYRERASVAIFRLDLEGSSQDRAEYERLRGAAKQGDRKP